MPIFFISVGANFDLGALFGSGSALLLLPILLVAAYAVKFLPALVFVPLSGWRKSLAAGALMSSRLSLIIAASAIALELDLVKPATNSAIILLAIVTCTASPILFNKILPQQGAAASRAGIVILGSSELAMLLGQRLKSAGEQVCFIARDQDRLRSLPATGVQTQLGDPTDMEVLRKAGLPQANALIALSDFPETTVAVCRIARESFNLPVIIARAEEPATIAELLELNVKVVQPAMATALALEGALHFPAAFGMMMNQDENISIADIPVSNGALAGQPLREITFAGDPLVVSVHRNGEVMVPNAETRLRLGDTLVLVGKPEALRDARRQLAS